MRSLARSTSRLNAKAFAASLLIVSLAVTGCSSSDQDSTSTSSTTSVSLSSSAAESASATSTDSVASTVPSASESASAATTSESAVATTSDPVVAPETSKPPPAPDTEVPAPGGGDNINETVAPSSLVTAPSVPLTETAQFGGGVTADLSSIVRQQITAQGPGEISGPGLVVTIKITNGSANPVNLDAVNVTLEDGNATPASPMSGDPYSPFSGDLAAGAAASAVYVFALPTDYKNPSTISVGYSTDAAILVFSGDAP